MCKPTESSRLMRDAGERICEYIPELHTKIQKWRVDCDGMPKRYIGRSIGFVFMHSPMQRKYAAEAAHGARGE